MVTAISSVKKLAYYELSIQSSTFLPPSLEVLLSSYLDCNSIAHIKLIFRFPLRNSFLMFFGVTGYNERDSDSKFPSVGSLCVV